MTVIANENKLANILNIFQELYKEQLEELENIKTKGTNKNNLENNLLYTYLQSAISFKELK